MLDCNNCKKKMTNNCVCDLIFSKCGTVYDHTLEVLKNLPDNASFELQVAALLHDIGKNEKTADTIDGKRRFIGHEFLGARMAKNRLNVLTFSKNSLDAICFLIEHHMDVHKLEEVSDKSIRRFIRNTGEYMEDLFILVDADGAGTLYFDKHQCEVISIPPKTAIQERARTLLDELRQASIKPFKYFDGNALMSLFDIQKPCREVGMLMGIQDDVIDEFGVNLTQDDALLRIRERYLNK